MRSKVIPRKKIERRRECTDLALDLGEREEQVVCSGDVSLVIFITSVSGSDSLASFTNRTFHLSRPPALEGRLMRLKEMEDLAAFSAREEKRAAAEERERVEYFSAERQWKSK